jgi:hypothetical protein
LKNRPAVLGGGRHGDHLNDSRLVTRPEYLVEPTFQTPVVEMGVSVDQGRGAIHSD